MNLRLDGLKTGAYREITKGEWRELTELLEEKGIQKKSEQKKAEQKKAEQKNADQIKPFREKQNRKK